MASAPPITMDSFVGEVRTFIRDFEELNRLISGEETSNRSIQFAVWLALDEWNTSPPLSSHTIAQFPSRTILLTLTVIWILTSAGILKARNSFTYNDGGFSVKTEEGEHLYKQWIQLLRSQVNPRMQQLKIALNIEGGWDAGVGSEYGMIHGWYGY